MIGICNGFQVLTRRLLPGALGHNAQGRFECRWVVLDAVPGSASVWTKGIDAPIHCPIAHGEGRYVHPDPDALAATGQVALRYRSTNPNGSVADIAGVCNPAGIVLGLMPHPENHIVGRQHPRHSRGGGGEDHLGLRLFHNGVRHAKSCEVDAEPAARPASRSVHSRSSCRSPTPRRQGPRVVGARPNIAG